DLERLARLGLGAALLEPVHVPAGLLEEAEAEQAEDREGRVPQPAEAGVPVAGPPRPLPQAGRRRRGRRPRGRGGEELRRQGRAGGGGGAGGRQGGREAIVSSTTLPMCASSQPRTSLVAGWSTNEARSPAESSKWDVAAGPSARSSAPTAVSSLALLAVSNRARPSMIP